MRPHDRPKRGRLSASQNDLNLLLFFVNISEIRGVYGTVKSLMKKKKRHGTTEDAEGFSMSCRRNTLRAHRGGLERLFLTYVIFKSFLSVLA